MMDNAKQEPSSLFFFLEKMEALKHGMAWHSGRERYRRVVVIGRKGRREKGA